MVAMATRVLCFASLLSNGSGTRARIDMSVSAQGFAQEVLGALASAPCPYAKSHEAKHFGITYGEGKSAFTSVQEQINQLSDTCDVEEKTEKIIGNLESEIAAADTNIPALEKENEDLVTKLESYKSDNADTLDAEACKAAASATSTKSNMGRGLANMWQSAGWWLKGRFTRDKDAHNDAYEAYESAEEKEEKAVKQMEDLAKRCAERANQQQAVKSKQAQIDSAKDKRMADKKSLQSTQKALEATQETVQTTAASITKEIRQIEHDMTNAMGDMAE